MTASEKQEIYKNLPKKITDKNGIIWTKQFDDQYASAKLSGRVLKQFVVIKQ